MALTESEIVLLSKLGDATAPRLFAVRQMAPESMRSVLRYILRDALDPLGDEDCAVAVEVIARACEARWRAIQEPGSD